MLDLFSGIGGFAVAAQWVWGSSLDIAAFCEIEEFPRKVLRKNFPGVPIEKDIKEMNGYDYRPIDLLTGGFPCQPFSQAGKQKGAADDRHLWPEMLRIIEEVTPRYILGENVPGIKNMELDNIITDLEDRGYTTEQYIIPAAAIGAPHRRDRIWILGYAASNHKQWDRIFKKRPEVTIRGSDSLRNATHTDTGGLEGSKNKEKKQFATHRNTWYKFPTQSPVCGGNDGLPNRVDRVKSLGNAIVPQVAAVLLGGIARVEEALHQE